MLRGFIVVVVFAGILVAFAIARDDAPTQPDWIVTLNARRSLWNDPALAELNLGVRVKLGEALVWGPVLNEEQAAEAVARVRLVPGITAVINETYILPADDLLRRKLPTFPVAPAKLPVRPIAAPTVTPLPENLGGAGVRAIPSRLEDLIADIRRSDRRFQDLRVSMTDGVATVTGTSPQPTDAMDFAERIGRLTGVNRVLLRTGLGGS